jgi:uncharacterized protein
MDAVWHGHIDSARVLLGAGADRDVRGHDGKSALDLAPEFGYSRIEVLLTERSTARAGN